MTTMKYSQILPFLALSLVKTAHGGAQPKVAVIESAPAAKAIGSLSLSGGSPWCQGLPTFWLVGNNFEGVNEAPFCQLANGTWYQSTTAVLDVRDRNSSRIPRIDCTIIDVNKDGLPDIACAVDANKGLAYNEVYLTNADGTLTRVYDNGLDASGARSMRPVSTTYVKGALGDMVFIATDGQLRDDGRANTHKMFLNNAITAPFFTDVKGPFQRNFTSTCAKAADISRNGVDDLIVCQFKKTAQMYLQKATGGWTQQKLPKNKYTQGWNDVRVKEMTKDKFDDLVVVQFVAGKTWLRIFKGKAARPYFDFTKPFFERSLPFPAPSLEVFDFNDDGRQDIYVVQQNNNETYCLETRNPKPWGDTNTPNATWTPNNDTAPDLLFRGKRVKIPGNAPYEKIQLFHQIPGCGGFVERFGAKSLILSQGDAIHAGHNAILSWGKNK